MADSEQEYRELLMERMQALEFNGIIIPPRFKEDFVRRFGNYNRYSEGTIDYFAILAELWDVSPDKVDKYDDWLDKDEEETDEVAEDKVVMVVKPGNEPWGNQGLAYYPFFAYDEARDSKSFSEMLSNLDRISRGKLQLNNVKYTFIEESGQYPAGQAAISFLALGVPQNVLINLSDDKNLASSGFPIYEKLNQVAEHAGIKQRFYIASDINTGGGSDPCVLVIFDTEENIARLIEATAIDFN